MATHFQKSTAKKVELMRKLYQKGWSLSAIGRQFKKHYSTIGYWLKGYKGNHRNVPVMGNLVVVKPKPKPKPEPVLDPKLCAVCKKEKKPNWIETFYCSMFCWDEKLGKKVLYY